MELKVSEKRDKFEKLIMWVSIISSILLILVLILIKVNVPDFKVSTLIFSIIGIVFLFGGIWALAFFFNKKPQGQDFEVGQEKLPRPATLEQCREIAKRATVNPEYADYINDCLGETTEMLGRNQKSLIYTYKAKGYYRGDIIFVMINMHYPNDRRTLLINPSNEEVQVAKMLLATSPESSPDVREIKTFNAVSGTEQTVTETTHREEQKQTKEDEKKL